MAIPCQNFHHHSKALLIQDSSCVSVVKGHRHVTSLWIQGSNLAYFKLQISRFSIQTLQVFQIHYLVLVSSIISFNVQSSFTQWFIKFSYTIAHSNFKIAITITKNTQVNHWNTNSNLNSLFHRFAIDFSQKLLWNNV